MFRTVQKITILQHKQISKLIPLFTKQDGHPCTVYHPLEEESIYNRDAQDIVYGANPDISTYLLFDHIPEHREEMADILDTMDLGEPFYIYTLNTDIPKNSMIRTEFNEVEWAFRVKERKVWYGANDEFLYVKLTLVGIS